MSYHSSCLGSRGRKAAKKVQAFQGFCISLKIRCHIVIILFGLSRPYPPVEISCMIDIFAFRMYQKSHAAVCGPKSLYRQRICLVSPGQRKIFFCFHKMKTGQIQTVSHIPFGIRGKNIVDLSGAGDMEDFPD